MMGNMAGVGDFLATHHDHLATWLGTGDVGSLDAFLAAHHDAFSLVTTSGEILGLAPLQESLRGAGGTQPGLSIEIQEVTGITGETHRFTERHIVNDSVVGVRIVTAVLADGLLLAVHETARQ